MASVGILDGTALGVREGVSDGLCEWRDGFVDDRTTDGRSDGLSEGTSDGASDSFSISIAIVGAGEDRNGETDGANVGLFVSSSNVDDGLLGIAVGMSVGS